MASMRCSFMTIAVSAGMKSSLMAGTSMHAATVRSASVAG